LGKLHCIEKRNAWPVGPCRNTSVIGIAQAVKVNLIAGLRLCPTGHSHKMSEDLEWLEFWTECNI